MLLKELKDMKKKKIGEPTGICFIVFLQSFRIYKQIKKKIPKCYFSENV